MAGTQLTNLSYSKTFHLQQFFFFYDNFLTSTSSSCISHFMLRLNLRWLCSNSTHSIPLLTKTISFLNKEWNKWVELNSKAWSKQLPRKVFTRPTQFHLKSSPELKQTFSILSNPLITLPSTIYKLIFIINLHIILMPDFLKQNSN